MLKRNIGPGLKVYLVVLLAVMLFIASCKKSEEQTTGDDTEPAKVEECEEKPAEAAEESDKTDTEPAKKAGDLVPIPIKLPKPVFVGTPGSFAGVTNLEKPLGKPRPPFLAPRGTVNVAADKPITSTDDLPIWGEIELITDGDKEASDGCYVILGPFVQHVTIDLGAEHNIYAVLLWHYHKQGRVYFDVIVQIADDSDFTTNVRTLFNNDIDNSAGQGIGEDKHYVETAEGKLIDAKGGKARYVRLYSNGNSSNELNNYIEVEVFGKPAK